MSSLLRPVFLAVPDCSEDLRSVPEQTMTPLLSLSTPGVESLLLTHLNLISLCPNTLPKIAYEMADLAIGKGEGTALTARVLPAMSAFILSVDPSL